MEIETYIIDSFTDKPFSGNPAGVCLLESELGMEQMQSIAIELGLSETAFVKNLGESNKYSIRYFSPKMEIPLCGHATLAASKAVFEKHPALSELHFINIQEIDLFIQKRIEEIKMEFPIYETEYREVPKQLLLALGIEQITNSAYNHETNILLIELEDVEVLIGLHPDFEKLIKSHDSINGVLVTAKSSRSNFDFESRYFWPWSGTNEDPVTGGTHTFLAKYWGEKLNKRKMNSFQCSTRTGFMEVELISETKMSISSQAQVVLKGQLFID